jgi:hypothetical protein
MSSFILPLTIDSRKIIFLDLKIGSENYLDNLDAKEDEYIIERDYYNDKPFISIENNQVLQSLDPIEEDCKLDKIYFEPTYDTINNVLSFELKKNDETIVNAVTQHPDILLEKGEQKFEIFLIRQMENIQNNFREVFVRFHYEFNNHVYEALMQFHFVDKKNIVFAGLDFGSESSQLIEGYYNPQNLAQINQQFSSIFSDVKANNSLAKEPKLISDIRQYDETVELYRSAFFLKKRMQLQNITTENFDIENISIPHDSIKFISLKGDEVPAFFQDWIPVPNLKLIHNYSSVTSGIYLTFVLADNVEKQVNFSSIKKSVYKQLIGEIVKSYLNQHSLNKKYLNFTVLVPNIYSITESIETKKIIRTICNEYNDRANKNPILGLEISSISESDASFYGISTQVQRNPGDYFISIDCGKGTTDFSIVKFNEIDPNIMTPVYRGGFAGAGNLINFAFLESLIYFFRYELNNHQIDDELLKKFFTNIFEAKNDNTAFLKNLLFEFIENCKQKFDYNKSELEVNTEWKDAKINNSGFTDFFEALKNDNPEYVDMFKNLLGEIKNIYNWNNFIYSTTDTIAQNIVDNLSNVIYHLNRSRSNCSGIVLTGRAFCFKKLKEDVTNKITTIRGLNNKNLIFKLDNNDPDAYKQICLKGIFTRNIKIYSDLASTPIEVTRNSLTGIRKTDIATNILSKILIQIKEILFSPGVSFTDNMDFNKADVLQTDFSETRFLSGGLIYLPQTSNKFESAQIVNTRDGYFIIAIKPDGRRQIVHLDIDNANRALTHLKQFATKSLIPGIVATDMLHSLK